MAGYVRNDTLNNIANGNVINAADLDGEFDAIVAAFHASTGHVHDGTAANGAPITKIGPLQEYVAGSNSFSPKTDNTYDLGSSSAEFKDAYIDGTAYIDAIDLNGTAITATGTEINYLSGVTSAIQTQLGNKQPLDAELTAIAGLTSAADKVPYFTGSGTAAVTDLTSFGRSLIDDVDASAARTTLGVVIGTNVQAYDAELAAIAGLTSAADKVPYFTGSGTASVADFSSFGRSLVDDADATAARTTLGLGTVSTQDSNNVTITGGSITGISDLAIADGGTGASTANAALNNLLPSQASNAGKYLVTDGTNTSWDQINISTSDITGTLPIANGGTGSTTASGARTALGLSIGTDVQGYDPQLADIAGLTPTDNNFIVGNGTNFVTESGSTARTSLGLGSIATQDASNVTISGGSITGITDLAVADGGTGASTAANARINLLPSYTGNANKVLSINSGGTDVEWSTPAVGTGDVVGPSSAVSNRFAAFDGITGKLIKDSTYSSASFEPADATILKSAAIGVTVQGYDAQLADVAGLAVTDGNFIVGNGTNFVAESGATARTSLGLGTGDSPEFTAVNIGNATDTTITRSSAGVIAVEGSNVLMASNIGSTVQAYDAQLADVAGLTPTDNGVIIGNGTNFVVESGATLKTSLGLTIGTDVQAYDSNLTSFVNTFTLPTTDGTANQVLQTNGSGTLSFATPSGGSSITISNDTSTASDLYPTFVTSTSGTASSLNTGNAKLLYKPSTGELKADVPVAQNGIFVNSQTVNNNYTIATGFNGSSEGPITVASGVTVTVGSGSTWGISSPGIVGSVTTGKAIAMAIVFGG